MGPRGHGGITTRRGRFGAKAPHENSIDLTRPLQSENGDVDAVAFDSPLIGQYQALKAEYPEALLLSRVGDFYEAYGDDAEDLARSLNILLTSKEAGKGRRIAMAGVPHHSVDIYLGRLMRQCRVVAIAEQMEQPVPNRLVRREIVRILTPGTVLEDQFLHPERNNYLCALTRRGGMAGLASADVSTGQSSVRAISDEDDLAAALDSLGPAEIVVSGEDDADLARRLAGQSCRIAIEADIAAPAAVALQRGAYAAAQQFSAEERAAVDAALDLLASYLTRLKFDGGAIASRAQGMQTRVTMMIDPSTRRHLDLLSGSGDNAKASLIAVLARTRTPMGSRLLAARICAPLVDADAIRRRLDGVEALCSGVALRLVLQDALAGVGDIERIVQKANARRAGPRDLATLRRSLDAAALLQLPLERTGCQGIEELATIASGQGRAAELRALLADALIDDPPVTLGDGGAIRPEYSSALAEVVELRSSSRDSLLALEEATRARAGIKPLKIKYTQAFGYYFEIPRAHAASVPADFARRQSLVNAERFTNVELKELEAAILSAKSRQVALEREVFESLLVRIDEAADALLAMAAAIAQADVYCGLAQVAAERRYVRPTIVDESTIDVDSARHPVVEAFGGVDFVANDCRADGARRFLFITGPNMGGKSTYLRQTALLVILAQMGSFVPATRARLGVVDRLFTRIGAGDDIAAGRSTFFVEMEEMALILRRCTSRSLLLIDEVGRGTGTTDGRAIAQAICEYLLGLETAMPIVLFATHFHELVGLSKAFPVVENLHVVVAEQASGPVFSHRVLHGASSRSYGIAVGKMAGLPPEVVRRAEEIADEIESRPEPKAATVRRMRDGVSPEDQLRFEI